jgi:hypothetical protein
VIRHLVFALLAFGCASWRPTPQALDRRRIASELQRCYRESGGWSELVQACNTAAASRCALAGLPDECGRDELYMRCVTTPGSGPPGTTPPSANCVPPLDTRRTL